MSALLPSRIVDDDLTIQRWTETDVDAMEALITDNLEHLRPWMAWAAREPIAPQQRRRLFDRWDRYWATGKGVVYSIRVGEKLIGGCAIHRRIDSDVAEIGYWLGQNSTGRGVATRTSRALTDAAFGLDDIDVVQISHERSNARSGAVAERLGYSRVPTQSANATCWQMDRSGWFSPSGDVQPSS